MVVLLVNGLFLHKVVSPHFDDRGLLEFKSKRPIRRIAFVCGAVSLISWTNCLCIRNVKEYPILLYNLYNRLFNFLQFVEWLQLYLQKKELLMIKNNLNIFIFVLIGILSGLLSYFSNFQLNKFGFNNIRTASFDLFFLVD